MKTWMMLLCVVLMLCFAAGTLDAARPGGRGPGRRPGPGPGSGPGPGPGIKDNPEDLAYVEGVIKAIKPGVENRPGTITVAKKNDKGVEMQATLIVNADTQIFIGDEPKQLTDLTVGDKVNIAYTKPPRGTDPVAVLIRVTPSKGGHTTPDAPKQE